MPWERSWPDVRPSVRGIDHATHTTPSRHRGSLTPAESRRKGWMDGGETKLHNSEELKAENVNSFAVDSAKNRKPYYSSDP